MPTTQPHTIYVPTFDIKVEGASLPPVVAKKISQVSVNESLNTPGAFDLEFYDPGLDLIDPQQGLLTEGTRVEIWLGFVGQTRRMMVGEITSLDVNFSDSAAVTVRATGFDLLHRLTRGQTFRKDEVSDTQIVQALAQDMDLTAAMDDTTNEPAASPPEPRTQTYTSDLEFLEQLAQQKGYSYWVDGETLHVSRNRPAPNTVQLEWGKTLLNFSPHLSTAGQVAKVEVRRNNHIQREQSAFSARRSEAAMNFLSPAGQRQLERGAGGLSRHVVAEGTTVASPKEAETQAESLMRQQERHLVTGHGTAMGNPDIQLGTILDLRRVGRFEGTYEVTQVTHSVSDSGYQTSFQVEKVF
jgi:phage protein D